MNKRLFKSFCTGTIYLVAMGSSSALTVNGATQEIAEEAAISAVSKRQALLAKALGYNMNACDSPDVYHFRWANLWHIRPNESKTRPGYLCENEPMSKGGDIQISYITYKAVPTAGASDIPSSTDEITTKVNEYWVVNYSSEPQLAVLTLTNENTTSIADTIGWMLSLTQSVSFNLWGANFSASATQQANGQQVTTNGNSVKSASEARVTIPPKKAIKVSLAQQEYNFKQRFNQRAKLTYQAEYIGKTRNPPLVLSGNLSGAWSPYDNGAAYRFTTDPGGGNPRGNLKNQYLNRNISSAYSPDIHDYIIDWNAIERRYGKSVEKIIDDVYEDIIIEAPLIVSGKRTDGTVIIGEAVDISSVPQLNVSITKGNVRLIGNNQNTLSADNSLRNPTNNLTVSLDSTEVTAEKTSSLQQTLKPVSARLNQLSIDGDRACGVAWDDSIWCSETIKKPDTRWSRIVGSAKRVSLSGGVLYAAAHDGSLWYNQNPFANGYWLKVNNASNIIDVAYDSKMDRLCSIASDFTIWCSSGLPNQKPNWIRSKTGALMSISASNGEICGVAPDYYAWCTLNGDIDSFVRIQSTGLVSSVSISGNSLHLAYRTGGFSYWNSYKGGGTYWDITDDAQASKYGKVIYAASDSSGEQVCQVRAAQTEVLCASSAPAMVLGEARLSLTGRSSNTFFARKVGAAQNGGFVKATIGRKK